MRLKICCIEPMHPFIWHIECNEKITTKCLLDIENELIEQLEDEIETAFNNCEDLIITATYEKDEYQYGTGYGDILALPAYWILDVLDREKWNEEGMY